jgi:type IV pilus assembly protein PilY1
LNDVPALGTGIEDDKANWQHMTTFTMGLGLNGNLAFVPNYKQSGVSPVFEAIRAGTTMWPDPGTGSNSKTIDDLWHAAVNGRGEYFSARDPDTVVSGLNSALSGISARVASAAAAATSNLEPVAGDNFAYIASYVTKEWTGQLQAKEIDLATGQPAPTAVWSAAEKLDLAVGNSCDNRTIKLFRAGASPYNLVDFIWDSAPCNSDGSAGTSVAGNLSATEKAHFQPTGVDTTGATINEILKLIQYSKMSNGSGSPATVNQQSLAAGANLLNFVRGHRGKEGFKSLPLPGTSNDANKLYRERSHVLGDIISAQPVFVKAPQLNYIDDGYATFRSNNTNRTPMVYSAGNDGMLHAFRAGTSILDAQGGTEAWAFIPTMVLPNLYKLASEDYETDHKFFVDGTPTVADVFDPDRLLGSTDPGAGTCADHPENCWRTILVGGLNKGGKGYYALDITDPDVPKALWEFKNSSACMSVNSTTKAAVGNVYTDCEIGYTYTNPTVGKLADGTWVVLLTSGYNNSSGEGFLYILNAVTGRVLYRIGTGSGDASNPSGLNHIAAWVDKPDVNNLLARAYGVDLNGNVWRFDLNDTLGSPGREASLLAQLKDAKGKAQPITTRPMLAAVKGQPWVYVGTGRYLGTDDNTLSDIDKQSIWAIKDQGATVTSPRSSLGERILTNIGEGSSTTRSVTASSCEAGEGWYADFPDKGERANISPKLQLGTLIFPTNVPSGVGCDFGGYGYINYVNYETGCAVTPDPPTPPDPNDPNPPPDPDPNDGDAGKRVPTPCGASQVVGINVVRLPGGKVVVIVTLGCGDTITIDVPFDSPSPSGKRVSWREILQ